MSDTTKTPDMVYELEGVIADIKYGVDSNSAVCICVRTLRRVQESIIAYHERVEGLESECGVSTILDEKPFVSFERAET